MKRLLLTVVQILSTSLSRVYQCHLGSFYTTDKIKNRLEAIQSKDTKMVMAIRDLSYQQRLLALNLLSLKY